VQCVCVREIETREKFKKAVERNGMDFDEE
jgi:hypothetical protein